MQQTRGEESPSLDSDNKHPSARTEVRLPCFDTLVKIGKDNPEQLIHLRDTLIQQLIDNAPSHRHHRLQGLQFRIDRERESASSALSPCLTLSEMMQESLQKLREILTNPEEYLRNQARHSAKIIPFEAKPTEHTKP